MSVKRAEFIICGRVQGVGFRYFVHSAAVSLELKGFAKNQWDGTVLTVVEGDDANIGVLHEYLKKGPSMARVERVVVNYCEPKNDFITFAII